MDEVPQHVLNPNYYGTMVHEHSHDFIAFASRVRSRRNCDRSLVPCVAGQVHRSRLVVQLLNLVDDVVIFLIVNVQSLTSSSSFQYILQPEIDPPRIRVRV